jgi:hypothetical protein
MYTDKDQSGNISVMGLSPADAKDIGAILFQFEYLIEKSYLSDSEKGKLSMVSAKLRFQLIDALK